MGKYTPELWSSPDIARRKAEECLELGEAKCIISDWIDSSNLSELGMPSHVNWNQETDAELERRYDCENCGQCLTLQKAGTLWLPTRSVVAVDPTGQLEQTQA